MEDGGSPGTRPSSGAEINQGQSRLIKVNQAESRLRFFYAAHANQIWSLFATASRLVGSPQIHTNRAKSG